MLDFIFYMLANYPGLPELKELVGCRALNVKSGTEIGKLAALFNTLLFSGL